MSLFIRVFSCLSLLVGIVAPSSTWAKYDQSKILQHFEEMVVKNATYGDPSKHPYCKHRDQQTELRGNESRPCFAGVITKFLKPIGYKLDTEILSEPDILSVDKQIAILSKEINFPVERNNVNYNIRIIKIDKSSKNKVIDGKISNNSDPDLLIQELVKLGRSPEEAIIEYSRTLQSRANCFGFKMERAFEKLGGLIAIPLEIKARSARSCILSSIARLMGGSGKPTLDSVLQNEKKRTYFTSWDRFALSLLYDPRVKIGDDAKTAMERAKFIVKEKRWQN